MTTAISRSVSLPPVDEMYDALCNRDSQYEGVFFVGVRTTGIFCRPTCSARKPKRANVDFYRSVNDALSAGFRPCKKCRPLETFGAMPDWLQELLTEFESDPGRRWTDADIRANDLEPARIRRWFKKHLGMTFHAYMRSRRLAMAMGQIQTGKATTTAAFGNGYESLSGFNEAFKKWSGLAPAKSRDGALPIAMNRILTPLGPMVAAVVDNQLGLLEFADRRMLETQFKRLGRIYQRTFVNSEHEIIERTQAELNEYFDGKRETFDVPIAHEGSEFQQQVWRQLLKIPYGKTRSYEFIARKISKPGAQRAVGRANGDNRIAIIIPCHRVIRSDGGLSGYGGQVWRKKWLLEHEESTLF